MDTQSEHKPMEYRKMEQLVRRMQGKQTGVEVKNQKNRFTCIPDVVTGEDVTSWLRAHVTRQAETEEACHLANLLCYHGYLFPVVDSRIQGIREDTTPYRFQDPGFWLYGAAATDYEAYASYLMKRSLRNKQRHGLEEHEQLALDEIQKRLPHDTLEAIRERAVQQLAHMKEMGQAVKAVFDSQEKAFWRIHRPPPGQTRRCEEGLKHYFQPRQVQERFARKEFVSKKVQVLRKSGSLRRVKTSQAVDMCRWRAANYHYMDPFLSPVFPSNPWISEDHSLWELQHDLTVPASTQAVRRWELSFWDLLADPKGRAEFQTFLEKEYSLENLRFWTACEDVKFESLRKLPRAIDDIMANYLSEGSPYEVNIDSGSRQEVVRRVGEGRKGRPSRFTFLQAQQHICRLMMKDTYVRFLRSDQFQQRQTNAQQMEAKKGFFGRGFLSNKKPLQNPSPKVKVRGTCSLGEEERGVAEGGAGAGSPLTSDPRHAHSTGNLLDLEDKAVLLRFGKSAPDSSSCMRKCDTSPSLSGRHDRASFTKGGSFNRKQQQHLREDSLKHRSMNLNNTSAANKPQ